MIQYKTKNDLIQNPENLKPHVVLLGAGASLAAFPNGDKNGLKLPIMIDFVEVLGLEQLLKKNNIQTSGNFEDIYSNITNKNLKKEIENKIYDYFSQLKLPEKVTDYDRLLLSLRNKDAIFTFNWDPFLFDAYARNRNITSLPEIFFLHGNVSIAACINHSEFGSHYLSCTMCGNPFQKVPLLYPIQKKDYSNSNNYIKESWNAAEKIFSNAFTLTIYGFSAPNSDVEAVTLLKTAWYARSNRQLEHIEIIDIDENAILERKWAPFTPTGHYQIYNNIKESRLWNWPRRSCESLLYPMRDGVPCEAFPLPETEDHKMLQTFITDISKHESNTAS